MLSFPLWVQFMPRNVLIADLSIKVWYFKTANNGKICIYIHVQDKCFHSVKTLLNVYIILKSLLDWSNISATE